MKRQKRISRIELYSEMASLVARRGSCGRLQVGVVAVKERRVIATGYNGPPKGQPHCSDEFCSTDKPCVRAIHAEANLISFCAKHGIPLKGTTLIITHSPCEKCAELIVQSGVKAVVYGEQFRDETGLNILKDGKVEVYNVGVIMMDLKETDDTFAPHLLNFERAIK